MKPKKIKINQYLLRKIFFWTWLFCIAGFVGVMAFLATTELPETPQLVVAGLLGFFGLGVGSFVFLIATFALSKNERVLNKKKKEIEKVLLGKGNHQSIFSRDITFSAKPTSLMTVAFVGFIFILLFLLNDSAKRESEAQSQNKTFFERTNETISPPVQNPTPTIKQVKAYPTTDPDPIIDCESSYPECVGSSIRVRRSQCSKITCCQVGNTWSIYPTNEKCDEAQDSYYSQQIPVQPVQITNPTSNKVPVYLTYGTYTVYCPQQNVAAVQSIDADMKSKAEQWATDFNNCAKLFYDSDPCYVACENAERSQLDSCYALYGYSGEESSSCTSKAFDGYGSCISSCPSPYTVCDYVYAEQKRLNSQISDLCK